MKKMVLAGLLAISLIALSQQNASAWTNHKFSIGLNWNRQAGGNNFLWGAFHNGQPPGPEAFGGGFPGGGFQGGVPTFAPTMPYHSGGGAQPYQAQPYQAQPYQAQPFQAPMPGPVAGYPAQQNPYAGSYYPNSPFQYASYPRESANYYYYAPQMYYYYGW